MDHFQYRNGELFCEDVPIAGIAAQVGTPTYVYSRATFTHHYQQIRQAFAELEPTICYSVKSCQNVHICRMLAQLGAGFDVVSGGELYRVRQAGGDMSKVVFAGVGKTDDEIGQAIEAGIGLFNVESEPELENLTALAARRAARVRAALRINPDVDPRTHAHTATGKRETKFGIDLQRAKTAFEAHKGNQHVELCGLHVHIGSPVNSVQPYVEAIDKTLALLDRLTNAGLQIDVFNIGGGFGAHYEAQEAPSPTDYAGAIVPLLRGRGLDVFMEPGRSIAANAGVLVARVLYVKQSGRRRFVIVDAAMNDLIRPALYGAFHFIWPVAPGRDFVPEVRQADVILPGTTEVDVVGPVCETGDFLGKSRRLPPTARGDLLAVFSAGAYAFVMSSQYNSRPRAAEVLVDGEGWQVVRRRETYEDLVAPEQI